MQGGCLTAELKAKGVLLLPKPPMFYTSELPFGCLGHLLVILGSRGTPNGHTEAQMSVFIDFFLDLGSLLGLTVATFCRFSVIWDDRKEHSFQVHDFGGRGMEIMLECNGCMCYNHRKYNVF